MSVSQWAAWQLQSIKVIVSRHGQEMYMTFVRKEGKCLTRLVSRHIGEPEAGRRRLHSPPFPLKSHKQSLCPPTCGVALQWTLWNHPGCALINVMCLLSDGQLCRRDVLKPIYEFKTAGELLNSDSRRHWGTGGVSRRSYCLSLSVILANSKRCSP